MRSDNIDKGKTSLAAQEKC